MKIIPVPPTKAESLAYSRAGQTEMLEMLKYVHNYSHTSLDIT